MGKNEVGQSEGTQESKDNHCYDETVHGFVSLLALLNSLVVMNDSADYERIEYIEEIN